MSNINYCRKQSYFYRRITLNPDKTEFKVYYDSRTDRDNKEESVVRKLMMDDPTELVDKVLAGYKLTIIMGRSLFIDFQYEKIGDIILMTELEYLRQ